MVADVANGQASHLPVRTTPCRDGVLMQRARSEHAKRLTKAAGEGHQHNIQRVEQQCVDVASRAFSTGHSPKLGMLCRAFGVFKVHTDLDRSCPNSSHAALNEKVRNVGAVRPALHCNTMQGLNNGLA